MTTERKILVILGCLWIVFVLLVCWLSYEKKLDQNNPGEFIEKIDSLDSRIDSVYVVRDSILEKIDTVYIKLEDNNKQYEKNFNLVVNNDTNEDYRFFLDYINSNRARLDSCISR